MARRAAEHRSAPDRSNEQLGAAILVEENDTRIELARLRQQEVERHGLARSRGADDGKIAEIALMDN